MIFLGYFRPLVKVRVLKYFCVIQHVHRVRSNVHLRLLVAAQLLFVSACKATSCNWITWHSICHTTHVYLWKATKWYSTGLIQVKASYILCSERHKMKIRSLCAYCLRSAKCLFVTMLTRCYHWPLSWISWSQFTLFTYYLFKKDFSIRHLSSVIRDWPFVTRVLFKTTTFHISSMRAIFTAPQNCVFERDVSRLQRRLINLLAPELFF